MNLKTSACVFVWTEHENGAFRKRWRPGNHVISLAQISTNPKWPVIDAFLNFVVWMENNWCVFKVPRFHWISRAADAKFTAESSIEHIINLLVVCSSWSPPADESFALVYTSHIRSLHRSADLRYTDNRRLYGKTSWISCGTGDESVQELMHCGYLREH